MLEGVCGFGEGIGAFCCTFPVSVAPVAAPSATPCRWLPPFIQSCKG